MYIKYYFKVIVYGCLLLLLVGCVQLSSTDKKKQSKCNSMLIAPNIIQCYKNDISLRVARRIDVATRHLTSGDWPYSFQILIQLRVEKTGQFQIQSVLNSSESRLLNKKVMQSVAGINELNVPDNSLFDSGDFSTLKLLVKPARTPIIGNQKLIDDDAIIIYIHKLTR